jgi:hypothetical protein
MALLAGDTRASEAKLKARTSPEAASTRTAGMDDDKRIMRTEFEGSNDLKQ